MEDHQIVELFFKRDDAALEAVSGRYGSYCRKVAGNILHDPEDVEEALADTWLKVWNAVPPHRPKYWNLFLAKITRGCALDIWRKNHAACRGGGQTMLALEELRQCVSSEGSPEKQLHTQALIQAVSAFVDALPDRHRVIFLRRYFYMEDIGTIAGNCAMKEANVRMLLSRIRQKLKKHLIQEGLL